jgi:plastocyanin
MLPIVAGVLVSIAATACSERELATAPSDTPGATEVVISDFAFSAPTLTIDAGETVRWRNTTSNFHTVTPEGHSAFTARQTTTRGQTFETRFDTPGRYRYFCEPHRSLGMTGEIVVR